MILLELKVPWEDKMEKSILLKCQKYTDLTLDLNEQGHVVQFFVIELGAQISENQPIKQEVSEVHQKSVGDC